MGTTHSRQTFPGDGPDDDAVFDVRLSALPARTLKELRFTHTRTALDARADSRAQVDRCTAAAAAELFRAIGAQGIDPQRQKNLLRIKRALGRGRVPGEDVLTTLPAPLADALRRVDDALARHLQEGVQVETAFAADRARTRELLAEHVTAPLLRNGVLQSAPSLEDLVDSDDWPQRMASDKRAARVAQFVYRAAAKTSPFSTFTCTGRPGAEGSAGRSTTPDPGSTRLVRQLDGKIWALLIHDLAERPAVAARWDLRPNPSLTWVEALERFVLLGPPPAEQLRSFPDHPAIRLVHEAPSRTAAATTWSRRVAGCADDSTPAADTVETLLRSGVLEAVCPVSESVDQPVGDLVAWIEQHGVASDVPYLGTLRRLATVLAECPSPTDPQRLRTEHRLLDAAVRELLAMLGRSADDLGPDLVLVHESAVLTEPVTVPAAERPSAADLATVSAARSWLAVLDVKWPGRLAVSTYAAAVVPPGRSVPLLQFYQAVHQELQRGQGPLADHLRTWFSPVPVQPGPSTRATQLTAPLLELLHERQRCTELVPRPSEHGDGVTRLSLQQVADQLRTRPERLRSTGPAAVYLQAASTTDARWVVNVVHGGHGRGRARTDHLMRCAGLDPAPVSVARGTHTLPAEYTGTHGSSLNARRATLPAAIDYPCTTGPAPGQERLPVGRLHVRTGATGLVELVDARDGTRVQPTHVGMLADYQLPPLARFMERVFGDAYLLHPSSPPFASDLALGSLAGITRIPRVQVEDLVVQRRRWIVPAADFPRPRTDRSHATYLEDLQGWLSDRDLPATSYARAWGRDLRGDKAKSRKPMLLDLDSWWTVWELLRHSAGADFVVLDEALPDPFGRHPDAPAVELLIEVPAHLVDDEMRRAA
ncbi:hypothetical protein FBY24_1338 [Cellulomonas sp. SLBN-39]|nr:hypothetical protein FBY24_1338 [Cellulomonas sp. SLBN-39]